MSGEGMSVVSAALSIAPTNTMAVTAPLSGAPVMRDVVFTAELDPATRLANLGWLVDAEHTDPSAKWLAVRLHRAVRTAGEKDRKSISKALAVLDQRIEGARRVWERVNEERLGLLAMAASGILFNSGHSDPRTEVALSVGRMVYEDIHLATVAVRHELLGTVGPCPLEETRDVLHLALAHLHACAEELEPAVRDILSEAAERAPNLAFLRMSLWFDKWLTRLASRFPRTSSGLDFLFK